MDLHQLFRRFQQQYPQTQQQKWLVAVSGGIDSVMLAFLCKQHQVSFAIAHCNFNLRGSESLNDKVFVEKLAIELEVDFHVKDFDTNAYMAETGKSVQVAARDLRYQWFRTIAETNGYRFIAIAHHAADNQETVLMQLFRGTGVKGLRGIQPLQANIVRPLLYASKELIETFAQENKLEWVEDSSNNTNKYTRNYIRHHVLPALKQAIPQSDVGFEKSMMLLGDTEILYNEAVALHKKKLVEKIGNEIHLPVLKLAKLAAAKTILFEIIIEYGFIAAQLDDVFNLINSESGKYVASLNHRIIRNRAWLIIAPKQAEKASLILIESGDKQISYGNGVIDIEFFEATDFQLTDDANTASLDATDIKFPLLLRPWKTGDYFYPLGMRKKKKLSRFFSDKKLSKTEKEKIWVIECDKKILWVIGQRIDDRFKIEKSTTGILKITATAGA